MVFDSFAAFAKRVIDAAKKGGLAPRDLKKLERLLARDGKRNRILAAGLVSAMKAGGAKEIEKVGDLFEKASERIEAGKPPFTDEDANALRSILKKAGVSEKTTRWVSKHIDDLLAEEIKNFISSGETEKKIIPVKKFESTNEPGKKQEKKEEKKLAAR